jgi:mannose-6-phosphate isomerase class I
MDHLLRSVYKVIPILIEQKTWGGEYITASKNISSLREVKIGQSYEISAENMLYVGDESLFEVGSADSGDRVMHGLVEGELISLKNLVRKFPDRVLGEKSISMFGSIFPLLIKLNQSLGNSFQLHIPYEKEKSRVREFVNENPFASVSHAGGRLAKPESWYFLKPGYVSLGIREDIDPDEYQQTCKLVELTIHEISKRVRSGVTSIESARTEIAAFLTEHDPHRYVNLLHLEKGDIVDLAMGGIHHSWEDDGVPGGLGNIVYEIQLNRKDPISTIRAYDQGKIAPDGRYRKLNIDEYFEYLETDPKFNDPKTHIQKKRLQKDTPNAKEYSLVSNQFYQLKRFDLTDSYTIDRMESFHHLYVHSGEIWLKTTEKEIHLHRGESAFVPMMTGQYEIIPTKESHILCASI